MKTLILLICLLFSPFASAEVYAKYYNYYNSTTVFLTDQYTMCDTYDKPLMALMYDNSSGEILKYGCYGLDGNDVTVLWDDQLFWVDFYPATYFTILVP